MIIFRMNRN